MKFLRIVRFDTRLLQYTRNNQFYSKEKHVESDTEHTSPREGERGSDTF